MQTTNQIILETTTKNSTTQIYKDLIGNCLEIFNDNANSITAVLNGHKMQLHAMEVEQGSQFINGDLSLKINNTNLEFCKAEKILFTI